MNLDRMKALVAQGESPHLEFKAPISLRSLKRELLTLKTQGILGMRGHTNRAVWFVAKEPKED